MDILDVKMGQLKKFIYADIDNPEIKRIARDITEGLNTDIAKARAIYWFLRQYIMYRPEPPGLDIYQRPLVTLSTRKGDCDQISALFIALAKNAGIPVKIKVVSKDNRVWSHLYPVVVTRNRLVAYDNSAYVLPEHEVTGYVNMRIIDV